MLLTFSTITWGEVLSISGENISKRQEINATDYDTIVFMNSRFDRAVIISGNENLKTVMIFNCEFADLLTIKDNPAITNLTVAASNFKKHLLIFGNNVEGATIFNNNLIIGYFQLSKNQIKEKCTIKDMKVEHGISCSENIFLSIMEINVSDFNLRSVLYDNHFNAVDFNDAHFGILTIQDNYLEKSVGFADCTFTGHLTIRQLNDSGDPNSKRSINFYNTSVFGTVTLEDIDTTILLYNLLQLDFHQDIFIDYGRLTSSIGLVTKRIVHSPQSVEHIGITNPYKELTKENAQKFKQLIYNIKTGYDKRGDKDAKIQFTKWEWHYRNSFNKPFIRMIKTILFYASFEKFLNIYIPLVLSMVICIVFMFIYLKRDSKKHFIYLKIDKIEGTGEEKIVLYWVVRYFISFMVSTSAFCNLPTTKKLREDDAKNIAWVEGMIGLIILIIIGAVVGRIASL